MNVPVLKKLLQEKLKAKAQAQAESCAANTQSKSEHEIEDLRERIRELEQTIEEQGTKVKRDRVTMVLKTEKILAGVATTWEKEKEEMRKTEQELTQIIHEKKLRIKELELESKQDGALSRSLDVAPLDILRDSHLTTLCDSLLRPSHSTLSCWRNLGFQLGFTKEELEKLFSSKLMLKYDLRKMLKAWILWYPGDRRGSTHFATYSDLQIALIKAGLEDIIHQLLPFHNL